MATGAEVLELLIPNGGWIITGESYEGIVFLACDPISEAEFKAGFAQYDKLKAEAETKRAADKAALLVKLGITADEAKLLLG